MIIYDNYRTTRESLRPCEIYTIKFGMCRGLLRSNKVKVYVFTTLCLSDSLSQFYCVYLDLDISGYYKGGVV